MATRILVGDALERLRELPDESVHCCITSPPYWGLRAYRGDPGMIGLEPTFDEHLALLVAVFREVRRVLRSDGTCWLNYGDAYASHDPGGYRQGEHLNPGGRQAKKGSGRNRAGIYRPMGLKPKDLMLMPARVALALQADGWWVRSEVVWHKPNPMPESVTDRPTNAHEKLYLLTPGERKSRVVAFANLDCQRFHFSEYFRPDGLSVRGSARLPVDLAAAIFDGAQHEDELGLPPLHSEVWKQRADGSDSEAVRNLPMKHRPAVWAARFLGSHVTAEQFMGEVESLRVAHPDGRHFLERWALPSARANAPSISCDGEGAVTVHYPGEVCEVDFPGHRVIISRQRQNTYFYDAEAVRVANTPGSLERMRHPISGGERRTESAEDGGIAEWHRDPGTGANLRNVWTIATEAFSEAHFATFPTRLVEPCIRAGTSERGVCAECGAPWRRLVKVEQEHIADQNVRRDPSVGLAADMPKTRKHVETTGWEPTCDCPSRTVPAVVLDPFVGAGTVGLVADRLGRDAVLIEISPEYAAMAEKRIREDAPLLANVEVT